MISPHIVHELFFVEFVHTGDLESVNSLLTKYCPKRVSYDWKGMIVRSSVAAMDYNHNIDRETKRDSDGNKRFQMKVTHRTKVKNFSDFDIILGR